MSVTKRRRKNLRLKSKSKSSERNKEGKASNEKRSSNEKVLKDKIIKHKSSRNKRNKSKTSPRKEEEKIEPQPCPVCRDEGRYTRPELLEHYKNVHPDQPLYPQVKVRCEICNEECRESKTHRMYCKECKITFKKVIDYVIHQIDHTQDEIFRCVHCKFGTKDLENITIHLDTNHKHTHKYHCDICKKGFQDYKRYDEHKYFHTGEKPFSCEFCGKCFQHSNYLRTHQNTIHHEEITGEIKVHECSTCKKQYDRWISLKTHMQRSHQPNTVCEVCGKVLTSREKLKFHMRTHTGYKPFNCSYCNKCFTKKAILLEHVRVHTGEKPYNCGFCGKAFSQRSSLTIHKRSHTGERPFVCHICNKGFTARAVLNMHFKNCKGYSS